VADPPQGGGDGVVAPTTQRRWKIPKKMRRKKEETELAGKGKQRDENLLSIFPSLSTCMGGFNGRAIMPS